MRVTGVDSPVVERGACKGRAWLTHTLHVAVVQCGGWTTGRGVGEWCGLPQHTSTALLAMASCRACLLMLTYLLTVLLAYSLAYLLTSTALLAMASCRGRRGRKISTRARWGVVVWAM